MINILEKKMYDCTLYTRGRGGPAEKGTGTASSSGLSRDKREAQATGDEREARRNRGTSPPPLSARCYFSRETFRYQGVASIFQRGVTLCHAQGTYEIVMSTSTNIFFRISSEREGMEKPTNSRNT